jgi:hypothetical protein
MKKGVLLGVFSVALVLVMLVSLVSATDTEIKIKTLPYHRVYLNVIEPVDAYFQVIDKFNEFSGSVGEVAFTFSDDKHTQAKFLVIVKQGDTTAIREETDAYALGGSVELEFLPEGYKPLSDSEGSEDSANDSENNGVEGEVGEEVSDETDEEDVEEKIEDSNETDSEFLNTISGYAVAVKEGIFSPIGYSVIGAIVLVGVIMFLWKRRGSFGSSQLQSSVIRASESQLIADAQKKIMEAQAELKMAKQKGKIEQAQKRLEGDKKRLDRLMRGEDDEKPKVLKKKADVKKVEKAGSKSELQKMSESKTDEEIKPESSLEEKED